ncbi:hypothetical protein N9B04_00585 [bacterium]|nr:hypothetical protein [Mariniblastus sp.]MDA7870524.1 hypothetical protein [bacterium]
MGNDKAGKVTAPWDTADGQRWLEELNPWGQAMRLIHGTLQLETKKHPQEIRAAASMVVMFCRDNLWPTNDENHIDRVLELAARQLTNIKQLYEVKARSNPEMMTNRNYRNLLVSIDQEVRILEARMSNPKPPMPNESPVSWGNIWV